ncbi:class I SAM-dependent methyltransferase [Streptomyces sp. NPDC093085]|uniref:class I SAM-dependent methyltransferase n=1 Tax=Streptomyces sp. NPDC093085 TaxID=3155068 RepID=UPI00342F4091
MTTFETPLPVLDFLDKTEIRWLFGPEDRMPTHYRGPHRLSHRDWLNFAERLERREEISATLAALSGGQQMPGVGGGTGKLPRAITAQADQCTTVGPHRERVETLRARAATIRALPGHAEAPPFPDRSFDAVMATWVSHYVDDVVRAVREMIRVCDETNAAARIVLIGSSRDSGSVSLLNQVCVPLAGEPHDRQGSLLATASRVLAEAGFSRLAVWRKEALRPVLYRHFAQRPHAIGDQDVVHVAHPAARS